MVRCGYSCIGLRPEIAISWSESSGPDPSLALDLTRPLAVVTTKTCTSRLATAMQGRPGDTTWSIDRQWRPWSYSHVF